MTVTPFKHSSNPTIFFGTGEISRLAGLVESLSPVFFITGSHMINTRAWIELETRLCQTKCRFQRETVHGEPAPEIVDSLTDQARQFKAGCVVAIGGGSVLDAGKAVAAMICHEGAVEEFLEGIGKKRPRGLTLPFIAVPTTAGTGSEATKNAVISRPGPKGFKKSFRHDAFVPSIAVIDPLLAVGCPPDVTLACAMDALSQLLEARVSTLATPMTEALSRQGLRSFVLGSRLFSDDLYQSSEEPALRSHLAMAAYLSGVSLANAGLGTVHGIAGPMGAFTPVPHGVACGRLLSPVFRRLADEMPVPVLDETGAWLARGVDAAARPGDGQAVLDILDEWAAKLPSFHHYGITPKEIESAAGAAGNKNFPVQLNFQEIRNILLALV